MTQSAAEKVTLADVLRLVLPLNTVVVGGTHSGRLANWVTIITELADLPAQIQAGDIVVVPAGLQKRAGEAALIKVMPELARLSAAALLVFQPVPKTVNAAAAAADLPVIVVTGETNLREAHQGIAALLVDRQKQITERGMQLYRRLTEMSREGQGLAAMTEVMSRLTGKIVAVQDKRLEIQAITLPTNSTVDEMALREALCHQENLPPPLRNRKRVVSARQSHWQQFLPIDDVTMARLLSPIISGDRARGYVSVVGEPDNLDLLDSLTVEHGAAACALEMAKAKAVSEAKKALRGNFLEGLLAGRLPEREIERLAGRLDHNTRQPHAILTFGWGEANKPSLRRLETALHWLLSSHNRPALTHVYGNDHLCVFQALEDGDEDLSTAEELAHRLRDHLRAEFPKARLLCGLSGPAPTLADWPAVYWQAVQAMEVGKRLELNRTVAFNSLGIYHLLAQLEDVSALQQFCQQIVGPLADYDQKHRSSLVQTISAYFDNHANISQTAEALYVHRNTLLYRLERIQELTGQDLNQADMRLALHLALKLWQLRPAAQNSGSTTT